MTKAVRRIALLLCVGYAAVSAVWAQKGNGAAPVHTRDHLTLRLLPTQHPALTGVSQHAVMLYGGRALWGLEGAPGQIGAHYGISLGANQKGLALGANLEYGSSLGTTRLDATAHVAYGLHFASDGSHALRLAVGGGLHNIAYDMTQLRFGSQYLLGRNLYGNQPVDMSGLGGVRGLLQAGLYYRLRGLFVDFSALDLLNLPLLSLSAGYSLSLVAGDLEIMPIVQMQKQQGRWLPAAWVQASIFDAFLIGGGYAPQRILGLLAYSPFGWLRVGAEAGLEVGGLRGIGSATFLFSARLRLPGVGSK